MTKTARVVESYSVAYPNPIKLKIGDSVRIEKWEPADSEWAGWAFCIDPRGVKGWVAENYLRVEGNSAVAVRDYDATELSVLSGETVKVHRQELGWAWVENTHAAQGWVPVKALEASEAVAIYGGELEESVRYLASDAAINSLRADPYWPKWDSPWWHMLLLHEMGETKRIPAIAIEAYVSALDRMPLKIFPIQPGEMPADLDPYRETPCHCQLGNVYQVLAAWGVDVDKELPWIRPWFLRYQMSDGGLTCDNAAYLVEDEVPSSMVGTIAAFEAILLHTPRSWTPEEEAFLERGARFLIERKLMLGSSTKHNASERESAKKWTQLCFPRFYFYDVLRGLNALTIWSEKTGRAVPRESIREVLALVDERFPDGRVRCERLSYEGASTMLQSPSGEWLRGQPATYFPLLAGTSRLGEVSPLLSRQWTEARARIKNLKLDRRES